MKLLSNSLYAFAGAAIPTVVSVITIPMFILAIGPERYGVLAIAWLVLGYFGATDFGIGRAIAQRISSMRSDGPVDDRSQMAVAIWSALLSMVACGLIGAVFVYGFSFWYFGVSMAVEEGLRQETVAALWLLALCNPAMAVSGVLSGALSGLEQFKRVSIANTIGNTALLIFPLAAAWWLSDDVSVLIGAALLARLLSVTILAVGVWRTFLGQTKIAVARSEIMRLANFGAWVMITGLVGPLMVYADRLVIGALQDAVAVAAYAIPFQIASRTLIFPLSVVQALFPRFAAEKSEASRVRCHEYTVFVGQIFCPAILVLICLAAPLMSLWLGSSLDVRSVAVAQIVLAGFWVNAVANVPYAFIQARGNPRFTALLHLAELPVYLLLLWQMGVRFGLPGFAAAFAVRCALDCFLLGYRAGIFDRDLLRRLMIPAFLVCATLGVVREISNSTLLLGLAAGLAAIALGAMIIGMPCSIRARLAQLPLLRGRAGSFVLQFIFRAT